jgi:hypothetical protein
MAGAAQNQHTFASSVGNLNATSIPERLRAQKDAYTLRCAKLHHLAEEHDRKAAEQRIHAELFGDRFAFRNIRVKAHVHEVRVGALPPD